MERPVEDDDAARTDASGAERTDEPTVEVPGFGGELSITTAVQRVADRQRARSVDAAEKETRTNALVERTYRLERLVRRQQAYLEESAAVIEALADAADGEVDAEFDPDPDPRDPAFDVDAEREQK